MVLQPIQDEAGFEEALGVGIKAGMKNGGMDALSLPRMKQEMVFAHALPRYRRSENKLELMNGARGLQLLYRPFALSGECVACQGPLSIDLAGELLASIPPHHQHHIHCRPRAIVGRMYVKLHLCEILIS